MKFVKKMSTKSYIKGHEILSSNLIHRKMEFKIIFIILCIASFNLGNLKWSNEVKKLNFLFVFLANKAENYNEGISKGQQIEWKRGREGNLIKN